MLDLSCGVLISTPNVLNLMSRVRFLFTGFLRGRVRPAHYSSKPGQAPNIYLLHFYELYYLLFHYGFEARQLIRECNPRGSRCVITNVTQPLVVFHRLFWSCA